MEIWISEKFAKVGSCFRKIPEMTKEKALILLADLQLAMQKKHRRGKKCLKK